MYKDEALRIALEGLERSMEAGMMTGIKVDQAIAALRQALEQPEQEPVAWVSLDQWNTGNFWPDDCFNTDGGEVMTPLYTAPPKREWVGLTVEEVIGAWAISKGHVLRRLEPFARALEAKLKEKNNG